MVSGQFPYRAGQECTLYLQRADNSQEQAFGDRSEEKLPLEIMRVWQVMVKLRFYLFLLFSEKTSIIIALLQYLQCKMYISSKYRSICNRLRVHE